MPCLSPRKQSAYIVLLIALCLLCALIVPCSAHSATNRDSPVYIRFRDQDDAAFLAIGFMVWFFVASVLFSIITLLIVRMYNPCETISSKLQFCSQKDTATDKDEDDTPGSASKGGDAPPHTWYGIALAYLDEKITTLLSALEGETFEEHEYTPNEFATQPPADIMKAMFMLQGTHFNPEKVTETALALSQFMGESEADGVETYDCFISYRVASDKYNAELLYWSLKSMRFHPFLDKYCLKAGLNWKEGFCLGLKRSRFFIPLMSKTALEPLKTNGRDHSKDNVLLEYECALDILNDVESKSEGVKLQVLNSLSQPQHNSLGMHDGNSRTTSGKNKASSPSAKVHATGEDEEKDISVQRRRSEAPKVRGSVQILVDSADKKKSTYIFPVLVGVNRGSNFEAFNEWAGYDPQLKPPDVNTVDAAAAASSSSSSTASAASLLVAIDPTANPITKTSTSTTEPLPPSSMMATFSINKTGDEKYDETSMKMKSAFSIDIPASVDNAIVDAESPGEAQPIPYNDTSSLATYSYFIHLCVWLSIVGVVVGRMVESFKLGDADTTFRDVNELDYLHFAVLLQTWLYVTPFVFGNRGLSIFDLRVYQRSWNDALFPRWLQMLVYISGVCTVIIAPCLLVEPIASNVFGIRSYTILFYQIVLGVWYVGFLPVLELACCLTAVFLNGQENWKQVDENGIDNFNTFKKILRRRSRVFETMNTRYGAILSFYFVLLTVLPVALLCQVFLRVQLRGVGELAVMIKVPLLLAEIPRGLSHMIGFYFYGGNLLLQDIIGAVLISIFSTFVILFVYFFNTWILDLPSKTQVEPSMIGSADRLFKNESRMLEIFGVGVDFKFTRNVCLLNTFVLMSIIIPGLLSWINKW